MSLRVVHPAAIAFMICCAVRVLVADAFGSSFERVEFEGAPQPLGGLQQRLARQRGEVPKDIPGDRVHGYLAKPEGIGPFPAMIALHGCAGLHETTKQMVADQLVTSGYVALLVDSFATRGIDHACTSEKYVAGTMGRRTLDAFGALLFLAQRSFVDPRRVGVVGFSQGGGVALSVAEPRSFELFANPNNLGFRLAIAFYPPCKNAGARPGIPMLILIGALDDWTPAEDCSRLLAGWGPGSPAIEHVMYPGVHHAFDAPSFQPGRSMFGHRVEYNAAAANDANSRVLEFLKRHLDK
jgi:dienelactone hydrolase